MMSGFFSGCGIRGHYLSPFFRIWIIFILQTFVFPGLVRSATIDNESTVQEGSRIVFMYDLDSAEPADVTLLVVHEGKEYPGKSLHLEGDVGKVSPGKGKRIYWNVLLDFRKGLKGEFEYEILAGGIAMREPVTGMEMVFLKGGCFGMGDTFGDGEADERPAHEICVNDFYLGKFEVTQGQWEKIMGKNPSRSQKGQMYPVEQVSWIEVQEFIEKLKQTSGKDFRLPTEAEWEYAARSGGKEERWSGTSIEGLLGEFAWYERNSAGSTHPVGTRKPNSLGLHDMTGNVWEWVGDWYGRDYYTVSPRTGPTGPSGFQHRVLRGGSWNTDSTGARNSNRFREIPEFRSTIIGFRLAVTAGD